MKMVPLLVLSLLPIAVCSHALAQDAALSTTATTATATTPAWQITYNVGAQSDYVFRGISQTDGHPSGFAGADATYLSQWYVGAWTSNVDFSPSGDSHTSQEVDLYGGWRPTLAGINFDVGYIYYGYKNQPQDIRESYAEGYLRATHAFGPLTLGGGIAYSPNFPGIAKHALYTEANIAYAINSAWTASAAVGRQTEANAALSAVLTAENFNYNTWNAGITYAINDHTSLDLRYWDTDQHAVGDIYQSRVVAALKATF
jgi:uncharacterized protein (TIGR02001 family)